MNITITGFNNNQLYNVFGNLARAARVVDYNLSNINIAYEQKAAEKKIVVAVKPEEIGPDKALLFATNFIAQTSEQDANLQHGALAFGNQFETIELNPEVLEDLKANPLSMYQYWEVMSTQDLPQGLEYSPLVKNNKFQYV